MPNARLGQTEAVANVATKLPKYNLPAIPEKDWWAPVAELVAREGLSIREAATRLRVIADNEELSNTFRLKGFQRLLRAERRRYYNEIANDPNWSRRAAVGHMLYLVERLAEKGEDDKALEGLLKIARVEGWLNPDVAVNITQGLTDTQIAELKLRAAERLAREGNKLPS